MYKRKYPCKQGVEVFGESKTGSWSRAGHRSRRELEAIPVGHVADATQRFRHHDAGRSSRERCDCDAWQGTETHLEEDGSVRGVQIRPSDSEKTMDIESRCSLRLLGTGDVVGQPWRRDRSEVSRRLRQANRLLFPSGRYRARHGTPATHPDNTLIFYQKKFHWSWFIPLDDKVVSVGVVVPSAYFQEKKESKRDFLARELHELNPEIKKRIPEVKFIHDVHVIPNYSYQVKEFTGKGFMCIGDAHRFIDPIFSFGLTVTMREAQFAAPLIKRYLEGHGRDQSNPFAEFQLFCEKGIDVLEDLSTCSGSTRSPLRPACTIASPIT